MPMSANVDSGHLIVALLSGGVSAFFHWAAVQTGDTTPSSKRMRGELIASFASGMVVTWVLSNQSFFSVDPLGAFIAAAVVGFTYGPAGLIIAARFAARKFNLENQVDQQLETRMHDRGQMMPSGYIPSAGYPSYPSYPTVPVAGNGAPEITAGPGNPSPYDAAPVVSGGAIPPAVGPNLEESEIKP